MSKKKIIIISIAVICVVAAVFIVLFNLNNKPQVSEEFKSVSNELATAANNELAALEMACYPSKSNSGSIYTNKIIDFISDMALRSNLNLKHEGDSLLIDIPATQGNEQKKSIVIYSSLGAHQGNGLGDGPKFDDNKHIISGDGNYTLAAKSYTGIAFGLAIAKSKQLSHGPLRIVYSKQYPKTSETIIDLSATDSVNKIVAGNESLYDLANKAYKTTCNISVNKDNNSLGSNVLGFGVDIDNVETAQECIHTDSFNYLGAALSYLLKEY